MVRDQTVLAHDRYERIEAEANDLFQMKPHLIERGVIRWSADDIPAGKLFDLLDIRDHAIRFSAQDLDGGHVVVLLDHVRLEDFRRENRDVIRENVLLIDRKIGPSVEDIEEDLASEGL